ncbi:MAG TPA: hypothetical protein VK835_00180 [Bacteroidia bacterium]|jgi:hypothetical protein|nr:hypothetical protein [Bacteroidia bacterium]
MKPYLKEIGVILLGAFILCVPTFYNGFPILCYDSATYIRSGFLGSVSIDRPLAYGLFIRHSSMSFSLWFTVYSQCIILSGLLYILLKNSIIKKEKFNFKYLFVLIVLIALSNIGWSAAQIMADVFAPIFIISFICFLLLEKLTVFNVVFLAFVFILGCATHLTHLLMALVASFTFLVAYFLFKKKIKNHIFYLKRILIVSLLAVVSLFTCLLINYTFKEGGGFRVSRGGHVFLMAHFIQTGTMEEFLKENCDKPEFKGCKTCLYKDSLEHSLDQFLWTWNGTLDKTGGWAGTEQEYNFIIGKMFSDVNFIIKNIYESFRFGLTQLFSTKVGDGISPMDKNSPPAVEINNYFHDELNTFLLSKQNTEPYLNKKLETINDYDTVLLIISGCGILYYVFYKKNKNKEYFLGILIIFFTLLNAFLTAGLNAPCPRFQARIAWLIPLFFAIIVFNNRTYILKVCKNLMLNPNNK